jgi:hypothetical protein
MTRPNFTGTSAITPPVSVDPMLNMPVTELPPPPMLDNNISLPAPSNEIELPPPAIDNSVDDMLPPPPEMAAILTPLSTNTPKEIPVVINTPVNTPPAPNVEVYTNTKQVATECSFSVVVARFKEFIESISLKKLIRDAYIEIRQDSLFCCFAEPSSKYISGYLNFTDVKVIKTGTMILTDIPKLLAVINEFSGEMQVSYANNEIILKSLTSKKKREIKLLGLDAAYVLSFKGLASKVIDLPNKKIGKLNFGEFNRFMVARKELDSLLSAGDAINLSIYKFNLTRDNVNVTISKGQDVVDIDLDFTELTYVSDLTATFPVGLKQAVEAYSKDAILTIWMNNDLMVINGEGNYYIVIALS